MIFYFSGTGNSLYAAKNIAEYNNEPLISIAASMNNKEETFEYALKDNEVIGFVYPVYAWAPPKMVLEFINKLKLNNYKNNYTFTVATCGDNIGNTVKVLDNILKKKGVSLNSGFSMRMPNNYILMGDVDNKEIEEGKLSKAAEQLKDINKVIKVRKDGIYRVVKGVMPGVLTSVINPIFNKFSMDTKKFYVKDNCTGCGICASVCNCQSINIKDKRPVWDKSCTQCLACIHFCPTKAIQYGKGTEKKGRYRNPYVKVSDMKKV